MRTKTIRIMAALLAIVMLGGCTGTGADACIRIRRIHHGQCKSSPPKTTQMQGVRKVAMRYSNDVCGMMET